MIIIIILLLIIVAVTAYLPIENFHDRPINIFDWLRFRDQLEWRRRMAAPEY